MTPSSSALSSALSMNRSAPAASSMFAVYYDEVKYQAPEQPSFWFGGIVLADANVPSVEQGISDLDTSGYRFLGA
jgi:hypothetical protein